MAATQEASEAVRAFTEHEHVELARGVVRVHETARTVGWQPGAATILQIREVIGWFERELEPHLAWEETWLFPQLDRIEGTPWATRGARFAHRQLRDVVQGLREDELTAVHDRTRLVDDQIRTRLFTLEALIRAHFEHEERLLVPLLLEPVR